MLRLRDRLTVLLHLIVGRPKQEPPTIQRIVPTDLHQQRPPVVQQRKPEERR